MFRLLITIDYGFQKLGPNQTKAKGYDTIADTIAKSLHIYFYSTTRASLFLSGLQIFETPYGYYAARRIDPLQRVALLIVTLIALVTNLCQWSRLSRWQHANGLLPECRNTIEWQLQNHRVGRSTRLEHESCFFRVLTKPPSDPRCH
jgi:hypothetical protein